MTNPKRLIPVTVIDAVINELDHPTDGWRQQAPCRGASSKPFYPGQGDTSPPLVCRTCPWTTQCVVIALQHHDHFGFWGGHSYRGRLRIRLAVRARRPDLLPTEPIGRTA